ncbi:hypothetical protein MTO96_018417 [Rhipicephalus appendiculatus]
MCKDEDDDNNEFDNRARRTVGCSVVTLPKKRRGAGNTAAKFGDFIGGSTLAVQYALSTERIRVRQRSPTPRSLAHALNAAAKRQRASPMSCNPPWFDASYSWKRQPPLRVLARVMTRV